MSSFVIASYLYTPTGLRQTPCRYVATLRTHGTLNQVSFRLEQRGESTGMLQVNEVINLAQQPEYAPVVDDFCRKLKAFQQETSDLWLYKWEYE